MMPWAAWPVFSHGAESRHEERTVSVGVLLGREARQVPRAMRYGTFFNCILGFWLPDASLGGRTKHVILPIWVPVVIVLVGAAYAAWRNRRRRAIGACRRCGYDLTGNVSGVCPECGERVMQRR